MSQRFSSLGWFDDVLQDARYAVRAMRKSPGYTAVFSLVEGILLRPLAYSAPEMLVFVTGTYPNGAFAAMRQQLRTTDVVAYADGHSFNVMGLGQAARLPGTLISAELFDPWRTACTRSCVR